MAYTSSSSQSSRKQTIVPLSESLKALYSSALTKSKASRSKWTRENFTEIDIKVANAKRDGQFAKTDFEYSSFLLGTRCLDTHDPNKEKIIEELYASNFTKVQHGVSQRFNTEYLQLWLPNSRLENKKKQVFIFIKRKVAEELALLFNKNPRLRDQVRLEWMEHLSYTPHTETGEFIA